MVMKKWLIILCGAKWQRPKKQEAQSLRIAKLCKDQGIETEIVVYRYQTQGAEVIDYMVGQVLSRHQVEQYDGFVFTSHFYAGRAAGKLAAVLGCDCVTDARRLEFSGYYPVFYKMAYNCNVEAGFCLKGQFAVSLDVWREEDTEDREDGDGISRKEMEIEAAASPYLKNRRRIQEKGMQEESAVLIAVGKGVGSKEMVEQFRNYAKSRKFLFGVSRPVAMNGWAKIDEIIGVSGHIYQPKVCIAVGVSGSAAFYAGIEGSGWIVSINSDPKAPIIKMSDASFTDDYKNIWPRMEQIL
ncbi:MAG TPA: FAD-binding protein [Candidatus Dorea faecipullorum]|nr:FAD-binding protein [Candidatus Dorea faecipullorum]